MKAILVFLIGIAVLPPCAPGAALVLQPFGPAPDAPDLHADFYHLPPDLLSNGSPMVEMEFWLEALISEPPWEHEMVNARPEGMPTPIRDAAVLGAELNNDTHLLFDPAQVIITNVIETTTLFSATVTFPMPIDTLPPFIPPHPPPGSEGGPLTFLRSVNRGYFGYYFGLNLSVTYADGSMREFTDLGIIPEPSRGLIALLGMAGCVMLTRRRLVHSTD